MQALNLSNGSKTDTVNDAAESPMSKKLNESFSSVNESLSSSPPQTIEHLRTSSILIISRSNAASVDTDENSVSNRANSTSTHQTSMRIREAVPVPQPRPAQWVPANAAPLQPPSWPPATPPTFSYPFWASPQQFYEQHNNSYDLHDSMSLTVS